MSRHAINSVIACEVFRDASTPRVDRRRRSQRPSRLRSSGIYARSRIYLASSRNASDYGETRNPIDRRTYPTAPSFNPASMRSAFPRAEALRRGHHITLQIPRRNQA
jgi:hypothetical protein